MNLYIDTNIFLTFYHLTNDDLDELEKLAILIENGQITLYLPQQTRDEFVRNRDKKVYEAISNLKDQRITSKYPQIAKGYDEYSKLIEAYKNFEKYKNIIISNIEKDANKLKLNADILTQRIFESSHRIEMSDELLLKAKTRFDLGNPPGKGKSYGDAINWESLLFGIDQFEDLCLISDDNDFSSLLNKKELNSFLKEEWEEYQSSSISFYKTLSAFFKDKFPDIELSDELEKELLIKALSDAGSFISAKNKLHKLSKFTDFTNQQLNDIIEISVTNNQLFWISKDFDVKDVLIEMIKGREDNIFPELLEEFNSTYRPELYDNNVDNYLDHENLPF